MEPILQFVLFSGASIFVCFFIGSLAALVGFPLPLSIGLTVGVLFITGRWIVRASYVNILEAESEDTMRRRQPGLPDRMRR